MRLLILLIVMFGYLQANSKVALLIGNKDYDKANLQLQNPINDIEAIEETLESIGFEVELLKDATKREIIVDKLSGNELFAHVELVKGERSELANLANELL